MVELTKQVRCKDKWFHSILQRCRYGTMTADDHAFLHGNPTSVCGSDINGTASCGNNECQALRGRTPEDIMEAECDECKRAGFHT